MKPAIGDPTEVIPIPPGIAGYCAANVVRWGELSLFHYTDSFARWALRAGLIDEADGACNRTRSSASPRTRTASPWVRASRTCSSLHPGLRRNLYPAQQGGGGARPTQLFLSDYTATPATTYEFLPENHEGLWSMSLSDEC